MSPGKESILSERMSIARLASKGQFDKILEPKWKELKFNNGSKQKLTKIPPEIMSHFKN